MTKEIRIKTSARSELVEITKEVAAVVSESGVKSGLCVVFSPHTTAGITINEHADPDVIADISRGLARLVPENGGYSHSEGNSDAHIKTSIMNPSQTIIIENGRLLLGTWQGIFFCEFDGPRSRKAYIKIAGS